MPTKQPSIKATARARRKKNTELLNKAAELLDALKFVAVAQKKTGTVQQQFCAIGGNWLVAFNGVLMIGAKVQEDLIACPHTTQFIEALQKSGDELNITQLSENMLSVKSGDFRAIVPCARLDDLQLPAPDPPVIPVDGRIQKALEAVAPLATENAERAYLAGVMLKNCTAVGTNGHVMLEFWHGIGLPYEFILPKASAAAIAKCIKQLTMIGFSENSITFHYADESFIKTQIFAERFPNYEQHFKDVNPWALPGLFFEAVKAVEPFNEQGIVYFQNGMITSKPTPDLATTYRIEGLPDGMAFSSKYIIMLEKAMKKVYFDKELNAAYFFTDEMRGVLLGIEFNNIPAAVPEPAKPPEDILDAGHYLTADGLLVNDDIPF